MMSSLRSTGSEPLQRNCAAASSNPIYLNFCLKSLHYLCRYQYSWDELITAGRNIPNLSDKVFVLAHLAEAQTTANLTDRIALLREAKGIADLIPSVLDRVDRYDVVARTSCDVDPALCKECIREAMKAVSHRDDPE